MKFRWLKKIIEYGLYLLVFLLPLQTRWIIRPGEINGGYSEYGTISLYVSDIILAILLVLFCIIKIFNFQSLAFARDKFSIPHLGSGQAFNQSSIFNYKIFEQGLKINKNRFFQILICLIIFSAVSMFFAADQALALYRLGILLLGAGLCWLIMKAVYGRKKLLAAFFTGIFLSAGLGVWQFLTQSSFANKWLGLARHDPAAPGTSVVETIAGERWLRAYGGFDHPNILGAVTVLAILLLLALWIKKETFPQRQRVYDIIFYPSTLLRASFLPFALAQSMLFIFTSAVFFSFSRAAWLGLAAGLATVVFFALRQKNIRKLKRTVIIIGLMLFPITVLSIFYGGLVSARFDSGSRLEEKSLDERIGSYEAAGGLIGSNYLFGAGLGNYTQAISAADRNSAPSWHYQPVHNSFLLIWSEIGLFGVLSVIILFTVIFYYTRPWREAVWPVLIALIIMMNLDHWWWSLHFGFFFFCFMLGMIMISDKKGRDYPEKKLEKQRAAVDKNQFSKF